MFHVPRSENPENPQILTSWGRTVVRSISCRAEITQLWLLEATPLSQIAGASWSQGMFPCGKEDFTFICDANLVSCMGAESPCALHFPHFPAKRG